MAEISGDQLIDDSAIEKSELLSKSLKNAADSLDLVIKSSLNVSKAVKTEVSSFTDLEAQTKKLNTTQQQFVKIQDQVQKESKDTTKQLGDQGKAASGAGKESEKGASGTSKYTNALKDLKKALKDAQAEMVGIAATLGDDSKEFQEAAVKAGKLKDQLEDAKDALKNVSASPFENLSTSLGTVGQKLLSLDFGGAAASARQFATASKAITFKEALGGIKDFGNTLLTVGKAIFTNPLFLIGAVITALVFTIVKFRNEIKPVKIVFDFLGSSLDYVIQKLQDFGDWLGLTSFADTKRTKEFVENAQSRIDATRDEYDNIISIQKALGKDTVDIEVRKWQQIAETAKEGFEKTYDATKGGLKNQSDENKKFYKDYQDAVNNSVLIWAEGVKKRQDAWKKLFDYARGVSEAFADEQIVDLVKIGKEADKFFNDLLGKVAGSYNSGIGAIQDQLRILELQEKQSAIGVLDAKESAELEYLKFHAQNIEEQIDLEKELYDAETLRIDNEIAKDKEKADEQKKQNEDRKKLASDYINTAISLENTLLQAQQNNTNLKLGEIDIQRDYELKRAGDNAGKIAAINAKYDAQARKVKNDQLRKDKAAAIFSIVLNTAKAIVEAAPNPILIALAALTGGAQLAVAASQPVPQYFKGTKDAKGGLSWIGEKGKELIIEPTGNVWLSPSKPSLMNVPKHSTVLTHEETINAIAKNGGSSIPSIQDRSDENNLVGNKIDKLIHTVKNKKETHWNISPSGIEKLIKNAETRTKILNTLYH